MTEQVKNNTRSKSLSYLNFRLRIRPRMLRGINKVDMTTTIQGMKINLPICVAPTALQKMAHPDGEIGTAKG